ncbi:LysM peptidoglycan-binding domain-containing protein [Brevibacterium samyangense]|uniref:LysM domain-containing protein n=1 Tax=Brevibacterium samyangense TaxID=366888 RepID=A0ABN2TBY0_9MICO
MSVSPVFPLPVPPTAPTSVLDARGRRIVRLVRTLVLAGVVLVVGLFLALSNTPQATAAGAGGLESFDTVVVDEGESLWTIAGDVETSTDIRDVVLAIVELNGLDSQIVHPGQELVVPAR